MGFSSWCSWFVSVPWLSSMIVSLLSLLVCDIDRWCSSTLADGGAKEGEEEGWWLSLVTIISSWKKARRRLIWCCFLKALVVVVVIIVVAAPVDDDRQEIFDVVLFDDERRFRGLASSRSSSFVSSPFIVNRWWLQWIPSVSIKECWGEYTWDDRTLIINAPTRLESFAVVEYHSRKNRGVAGRNIRSKQIFLNFYTRVYSKAQAEWCMDELT